MELEVGGDLLVLPIAAAIFILLASLWERRRIERESMPDEVVHRLD
ncbi:MAG: hypothetical protein OK474_11935 [Thaumarchaeota archaeon]|nr:hypothetical protein [Nitrososphaerota archaeon]